MIEYCNLFNFWYLWYNLEILPWILFYESKASVMNSFWETFDVFLLRPLCLENKSFFQGKWLLKVPCNSFFFSFFWKIIVWSFHASWGILKSYHRIVSIKIQKLILKKSKILKKYHLSLLASKFYVDSFKNSTSFCLIIYCKGIGYLEQWYILKIVSCINNRVNYYFHARRNALNLISVLPPPAWFSVRVHLLHQGYYWTSLFPKTVTTSSSTAMVDGSSWNQKHGIKILKRFVCRLPYAVPIPPP